MSARSKVPKGITTSQQLANRQDPSQDDPVLAAAAQDAKFPDVKTGKDRKRVYHQDSPQTARPKSVYKEKVDDEWYFWYYAEDGGTVGKIPVVEVDEFTQITREIAYDLEMPLTEQNYEVIKKLAFGRTKWYVKDGSTRKEVPADRFLAVTEA